MEGSNNIMISIFSVYFLLSVYHIFPSILRIQNMKTKERKKYKDKGE